MTTTEASSIEVHRYDGEGFDLEILLPGERVHLADEADTTVIVETAGGPVVVHPGWWMVRDARGGFRAFAPGDFEALSQFVGEGFLSKAERFAFVELDLARKRAEDVLGLANDMMVFISGTVAEADLEVAQRFVKRFEAFRDGD